MTAQNFAFDIYGTLIDTEGVLVLLQGLLGEKAQGFSNLWRNKQLEYSFRRGMMNKHVDFSICTKEALEYTCKSTKTDLQQGQRTALMQAYKTLPAFGDVADCLSALKNQGHRIYAFSNGSLAAIQELLEHANLNHLFNGFVSMEAVKTFKPDPKGYHHFATTTQGTKEDSWLISGNTFDVIGAASYGMRTIWLQRNPASIFDPMGYDPTLVLSNLKEMPGRIEEFLLSSN